MTQTFKYILLSSCAVASASLACSAENANLPVVEILGSKYYVYKAKKGDSLFGIARTFGWDDATLSELNPTAISPLKKGMLIYYPTGEKIKTEEKSKYAPDEASEIRHKVKRGETVYSIAKMYNIPVDRLYANNPGSRDGIRSGESLLIRKAGGTVNSDNSQKAVFYSVKSGDTLFNLAQRYGVSVASIMESNPGVDEQNFRAGSTIKIPKKGSGLTVTKRVVEESRLDSIEIRQVKKNETWESIAAENGVSAEMLKEANPAVKAPKNKEFIAVPKIDVSQTEKEVVAVDPRETTQEGIGEIYEDVHKVNDTAKGEAYTVKVAVVAENPASKKDAEFLRGFLTGIDRQKRAGYRIEFKVMDGTESQTAVLDSLKGFNPTILFSTSETDLPSYLCEYALTSRTPLVNTFDVKNTSYTDNPYVVQMLTPSSLFNDNVAHYVKNRFGERTLVFVGQEDSNDLLAESLYTLWDTAKIKNLATADAVIPEMFNSEGKYLIYTFDVKKNDVKDVLGRIANVKEQLPLANISTLGRPNLIVFEDGMDQDFKKAALSIPSRFYIEKDSREFREFLQSYKLLFDRNPAKSLPLYAAVGYDTSRYFISALAKTKGDINKLDASRGTVQSDFDLFRTSNWSGFLNPPVYVIDYTEQGPVVKNLIDYAD